MTRSSFESLLRAWGTDVQAGPPRPGQHRIEVRTVIVRGVECVGRRSERSADSLAWEQQLLRELDRHGVVVPLPVPAESGADQVGGLTLTPKLAGPHPSAPEDWAAVGEALRRVHELTRDWPQRPGVPDWRGPVDAEQARHWARTAGLDPGPAAEYAAARAGLPGPQGVAVGRTRRRDITMTEAGPAFVDWDEARVDSTLQDFVGDPALAAWAGLDERAARPLQECAQRWLALGSTVGGKS